MAEPSETSKQTSFNFGHIKKHYPLSYAKLLSWIDTSSDTRDIVYSGGTGTFCGFYWLLDFFDNHRIDVRCYPNRDVQDTYEYYTHSRFGTTTNDVIGTRRDAFKEAFLAGFIFLEKQLIIRSNEN